MYEVLIATLSGLHRLPTWLAESIVTRCRCVKGSAQGLGRAQPALISGALNPQKATLVIRTSKATWGQIWPHHKNGYN